MNRDRAWILASVLLALCGGLIAWNALASSSAAGYSAGAMLVWIGIAAGLCHPAALNRSDAAVRTAAWILGAGLLLGLVAWVVAPAFRGVLVQQLGLGAILFGALAIWLGYTRRIGRELVCKACGYSVDADEPARRCPECGVELWPRGAVVRGRRARHPHLMGVGGACVALGLASIVPGLKLGMVGLMPTRALVSMGAAHTLDNAGYAELAMRTLTTTEADQIAAAILGAARERTPSSVEADWIIAAVSSKQLVGSMAQRAMLAVVRPRLRVSTVEIVHGAIKEVTQAIVLFECDATSERARDVFVAIGSPPNTWGGPQNVATVIMAKRIATGIEREGISLVVKPEDISVSLPLRLVVLGPTGQVPRLTKCDAQGRPLPLGVEIWGMDLELKAGLKPELPGGR